MLKKTYRALNTNVIIREVFFTEQKSAGGILVGGSTQYDMSRAEGILEGVGANAFEDFGDDKPKEGDRVVYARYAGKELGLNADGQVRRIMRDLDVLCIVTEEETN